MDPTTDRDVSTVVELSNLQAHELFMSGNLTDEKIQAGKKTGIPWCAKLNLQAIGVLLRSGISPAVLAHYWPATFTKTGRIRRGLVFEDSYKIKDAQGTWHYVYSERDEAWLIARDGRCGLTAPDSNEARITLEERNSVTITKFGKGLPRENEKAYHGIEGPRFKELNYDFLSRLSLLRSSRGDHDRHRRSLSPEPGHSHQTEASESRSADFRSMTIELP